MVDPCESRTTFAKSDDHQFYGRVFIGELDGEEEIGGGISRYVWICWRNKC